jgi:hypothetical protein
MFDPLSLLAVFAPVAVEAGKAAVQRFIAPDSVKALSVADQLQLEQADIERLKVIAALDKPAENVHAWVADARALMRPAIAAAVTLKWCIAPPSAALDFMVGSVWFYLFGERTMVKRAAA